MRLITKLKKSLIILIALISPASYAANLIQVFQQAMSADPKLQQIKFQSLSQEQNLPINRAALLPSLNAEGQYNKYWQNQDEAWMQNNSHSTQLSLNLNQSLFDVGKWFNYQNAKLNAQAAKATYGAALQDLMVRTAQAYFDVLYAEDQVSIDQKNQLAYEQLLKQNQERFKAGLVKTADVDNAQAAYQQSLAKMLTDQNNSINKQSALQAITGLTYPFLAPLKKVIPLISPQPANLLSWLNKINQQNLTVLSDRYAANAARANIKAQYAGHLPTLTAGAGYTHSDNGAAEFMPGNSKNVNLTLSLPLFSGGKVNAETRQAAYDYQADLSQIGLDYRSAYQQAQDSYYGVVKGIQQIKVDQQVLNDNAHALKSTLIAYRAGLSNISINDVITAEQNLYDAQLNLAQDKYNYLMSIIKLKQAAGTLSMSDMLAINHWLQS